MPGRLVPLGLGLALLPMALAQRYSSETFAEKPYMVGDDVPVASERLVQLNTSESCDRNANSLNCNGLEVRLRCLSWNLSKLPLGVYMAGKTAGR